MMKICHNDEFIEKRACLEDVFEENKYTE